MEVMTDLFTYIKDKILLLILTVNGFKNYGIR